MTTPTPKIRVLIAEDSPTARTLLVNTFRLANDFDVVGTAVDGLEAVELTRRLRPDVVTMDIQMPGIDGLEATRRIMNDTPTPIVVVSSLDVGSVQFSMEALRAGALAVLEKPVGPASPGWEQSRNALVGTVRSMSQVRSVRRPRPVDSYRMGTLPSAISPAPRVERQIRAIGIAASTGGPAAYHKVLAGLDTDFPVPLLIVQHIAHGFGPGFARWLDSACILRVKMAENGETLYPGTVYVAPDDLHLGVTQRNTVELSGDKPRSGFRPSASHLFESLAKVFGSQAAGVILTGMGSDGVEGLGLLKKQGGYVIAQDEASSDIFGMPAAAIRAGVTDVVVPLSDVAVQLERLVGGRKSPLV